MALVDDLRGLGLLPGDVRNAYASGAPPRPPVNVPSTVREMPGKNFGGVNSQLIQAMREYGNQYSQNSPYVVQLNSGYRQGDPRYHGRGQALDIQLIDKATGKALPNYQTKDQGTFNAYQDFAHGFKNFVDANHPEVGSKLRWGGYFSGPPGKYGAQDIMHFDLGGPGRMAGGSWETGLNQRQAALYGLKGGSPQSSGTVVAQAVRQGAKPGETPLPRPRPGDAPAVADSSYPPGQRQPGQTQVAEARPPGGTAYAPPTEMSSQARTPAQQAITRQAGPPAGRPSAPPAARAAAPQQGGGQAGQSQLARDIIKGFGPNATGVTSYREPGTGREIITGNFEGQSIFRDLGVTKPMVSAQARSATAGPKPAAKPAGNFPPGMPDTSAPMPDPGAGTPISLPPPGAEDPEAAVYARNMTPPRTPEAQPDILSGKMFGGPQAPTPPAGGPVMYDPLSGLPMGDTKLGFGKKQFTDRPPTGDIAASMLSPTPIGDQPGPGGKLTPAQIGQFLDPVIDRFAPIAAPPAVDPIAQNRERIGLYQYGPQGRAEAAAAAAPPVTVSAPIPGGPSSLATPAQVSPTAVAQAAQPMMQQPMPWWMQQPNAGWWTPSGMWGGGMGSPVTFGGDFGGAGAAGLGGVGAIGGW